MIISSEYLGFHKHDHDQLRRVVLLSQYESRNEDVKWFVQGYTAHRDCPD